MRGKRLGVAFAVAALAALGLATAALATPKPTPSPVPPPVVRLPPPPPLPVGPTPVADGGSGAELLEATGEQLAPPAPPVTTAPAATPPPATVAGSTPPPPAVSTAPAATPPSPAAPTRGEPVLPRDGSIVLAGVLVIGLAVALRAIRARERRIGLTLLAFCLAYLLVLAGLVAGVAGA